MIVPSPDFTDWQFFDGNAHMATKADRYLWRGEP